MKLSVIIVSWNTRDLLAQTLSTLRVALEGIVAQVFVVDNASTDGSPHMVEKDFPFVVLIRNEINEGFAKANNKALPITTGEYILLLNSDTIVEKDAIRTLVRFLDEHPHIGMIGPKVLNIDGTFQHASRRALPTPQNAFAYLFGVKKLCRKSTLASEYKNENKNPDDEGPAQALSGAVMMFRRSVYEAIGGLDEDFFMYGEDLDFCKRARDAGFAIWYVPSAHIVHIGGQSSKKRSRASRKNFYDAMWLYYKKHLYKNHWRLFSALVYIGIKVRYYAACVLGK